MDGFIQYMGWWCLALVGVYHFAFWAQSVPEYELPKAQWHCTSYDYNADMCIQYSRRDK